jgi:hypothetical protein
MRNFQPSRNCPQVMLLQSVSTQTVTQTAVTQLSTGSVAVVWQYTNSPPVEVTV